MRHVLIADDHAVTRRGVRELVLERYPDVEVTELADGDAVLEQLPTRTWDLMLLDVMMPGPGIIELLGRIRGREASVPVLVLTGSSEIEYVIETMKAGANGLLHKHQAADELLMAIERVTAGGTYLLAETAAAIARSLRQRKPTLPHEDLSERELDIFRRIALGRAIKEIGFDLGLSEKTVATYLARIREQTGLISHVDIARYALKNGLVE
ncbi:response regulator transcription factor [Ideonella sp. A 288]|uniref:response regulator transcription factor n=1 Tax=Ideonella sp. A 288 TaxID=1962181 RepID=UPI000B4A6C98|nr:response regulator transcription factor [Ideonella sp. A 288]